MILTKIQTSAKNYPDHVAMQFKEGEQYRKHTYRELIQTVASVAHALSRQGIAKGDRVAILSENRPEWVFAYLAITSLGAVVVPLDAQLTDKEVAVLLGNCEAKALCVSAATRQKVQTGSAIAIISFDAGDGVLFGDMMKAHPGAPLPPAPAGNDLAAILYTSGTTGDPKGVMLSHGNLAANCASAVKLDIVYQTDNLLCLLPLHHTYPAMACMLLTFSLGATMTILNSLKGPDIIACMQESGVSVMVAVPQLMTALRRAIFEKIDKSPLPMRLLVKLLLGLSSVVRKAFGTNVGKKLFGPDTRLDFEAVDSTLSGAGVVLTTYRRKAR